MNESIFRGYIIYDMDDPRETIEVKLAPELRRLAMLASAGVVGCGQLAHLVNCLSDDDSPDSVLLTLLVTTVFGWALYLWSNHVRVRVDTLGVHRRILFHWQHWPWELFESGTAKLRAYDGNFVFPNEPWYRRSVSIPSPNGEGKRALEIARRHWAPPEPEELPARVNFRYKLINRAELLPKGLIIRRLGAERQYQWDEVEKVVIHRRTRDHEDFKRLTCRVGGREIELECSAKGKQYIGAAPEKIAAYFESCVAPGKILVCTGDGPFTIEEADAQLALIHNYLRRLRMVAWAVWVFIPTWFLLKILPAIDMHTWKEPYSLTMAGLVFTPFVFGMLIPFFVRREFRKQESEILQKREALLRQDV